MTTKEKVFCGVCGLAFPNEELFERHIFKYKNYRWCGTKVLRVIEESAALSTVINNLRISVSALGSDPSIPRDKGFENYLPLELLTHIWRFYDMQKKDHHYFDDNFQKLMKDVETYLCYYQTKTSKWEFIKPKGEAKRVKYRRVFEDDVIRVNLGTETLQLVTKHDNSAYDIPLWVIKVDIE